MAKSKRKSKFESEVHLGLMVIIFTLVLLNVVSNFILFKARSTLGEETLGHLRQSALSISRSVQQYRPGQIDSLQLETSRRQYHLSELILAPARPERDSPESRRGWLGALLRRVSPDKFPSLAKKLFNAEYNELTRGDGSQYYYLYPVPAVAGKELLILTVDRPGLAYYDDSRRVSLYIQISALLIVAFVYFALSRFIFNPFRRIKEEAARAGRSVDDADDDTDAIVREYEAAIRDLKENEAKLLSRADSLALLNEYLLASSHLGTITFDPEGTLSAINKKARDLLRLDASGRIGDSYRSLFENLGPFRDDLKTAITTQSEIGYREHDNLFADQPEIVLGVTISYVRDRQQKCVGLLILINDLTELSRLRQELESRDRLAALGEMAGGLAHQIRNSLGAIGGYGTLIRKRLAKAGEDTRSVEALEEETREAGSLITRFLTFARPFDYAPEPTTMAKIVRDSVEPFKVRDDCQDIEFQIDVASDAEVMVDAILIKQALGNIIDNAIGAYPHRDGLVIISGVVNVDQAMISIEDFGCGMATAEMEKIYTPFYSSRPAGTGLGLPLARKIVDLHGGRISVESIPGRGTCFAIHLPGTTTTTESSLGENRLKTGDPV